MVETERDASEVPTRPSPQNQAQTPGRPRRLAPAPPAPPPPGLLRMRGTSSPRPSRPGFDLDAEPACFRGTGRLENGSSYPAGSCSLAPLTPGLPTPSFARTFSAHDSGASQLCKNRMCSESPGVGSGALPTPAPPGSPASIPARQVLIGPWLHYRLSVGCTFINSSCYVSVLG